MPKSSKPVVCICGSRSIKDLNLDFYLDPNYFGEVVTGGAAGVDTIAEKWAKKHNIEWVCYLPQYGIYGGKYAPLKRDEDMINYSDELICFWDGKSNGTKYSAEYALKMGRKVTLHLIQDLDV